VWVTTYLTPNGFVDSVEEDIVIIATRLPRCETAQPGLFNILSLSSE